MLPKQLWGLCIVETALTHKANSSFSKLLCLASISMLIVGIVTVWASVASAAPSGLPINAGTVYYSTIDSTVFAFLSTLFTTLGVFNSNKYFQAASGFLSAYSFVL